MAWLDLTIFRKPLCCGRCRRAASMSSRSPDRPPRNRCWPSEEPFPQTRSFTARSRKPESGHKTHLVTEDVPRLAAFYAKLLGTTPQGSRDYVELRPGGAVLAIVSRDAAEQMHGGAWHGAANRSAILEFEVSDVDAERVRIDALVSDWLQQPKQMPWGNRSMLFRDPDGSPVNIFSPPPARG